jgi:hypothetical protein
MQEASPPAPAIAAPVVDTLRISGETALGLAHVVPTRNLSHHDLL